MPTAAAQASRIELPPPAWGSPAHNARVRAEKEWTNHLRAHSHLDFKEGRKGKQARYVEGIDIIVKYTLPPVTDTVDHPPWLDEDDDEVLVKILDARYETFYQRTGDLAKPSGAFKTPPLQPRGKSPLGAKNPVPSPPIVLAVQAPVSSLPPDVERGAPVQPIDAATPPSNSAVQPRKGYLPLFASRMIERMAYIFSFFVPAFMRSRIRNWWSPLAGRPIGHI